MREAEPLTTLQSRYRGLAIEAHILELYANAVGTFVASTSRPYFLDPSTYKLADPIFGDFREKRWADVLLENYGLQEATQASPDGLTPTSFETSTSGSKNMLAEVDPTKFAKVILDYERERVSTVGESAKVWDVLEETGALLTPDDFRPPEFLVAPYFFADNTKTLDLNVKLAHECVTIRKTNEKVFAAIAVTRDNLTSDVARKRIVEKYAGVGLDGLLLWIADFREWAEDSIYLEAFVQFISELKTSSPSRQIYNLFGGYFSVVLAARHLLDGTVQGVGISEFRDPFSTGGGGIPRFYLAISHQLVGTDIADDLAQVAPELLKCSCSECNPKSPPGSMSFSARDRHFIFCRTREYDEAEKRAVSVTIQELQDSAARLDNVKSPNSELLKAHSRQLDKWAKTFENLVSAGLIS
jgi:hypothetical protein